tara:strand:+ start:186 stop:818 length:633 start_codon:yes stop_codon:yes gene_type:complete
MTHKNKIISSILATSLTSNHPWFEGINNGEYSDKDTGECKSYYHKQNYLSVVEDAKAHRIKTRRCNQEIARLHKSWETKSAPYRKGGKIDESLNMEEHVVVTFEFLQGELLRKEALAQEQVVLDEALGFFGGQRDYAHYDVIASELDSRLDNRVKRKVNTSNVNQVNITKKMSKAMDELDSNRVSFYQNDSKINPINESDKEEGNKQEVH